MANILDVSSLVTQLRNGARIVDGISFSIRAGETFALLGDRKSTLLNSSH